MTDSKETAVTAYNLVVSCIGLKQLPERAHYMAVALSLLYILDSRGLSSFSNICKDHPQIFTILVNSILDSKKSGSLAVLALRVLFFAINCPETAHIFCKDNYHFLENLIHLSENPQTDPNIAQMQVVTFSPTALTNTNPSDGSLLLTLQDPLLSATFVSTRYTLDPASCWGCDMLSDASAAIIAHLALVSPLARRIFILSPCNGLLAHSLANASFLELASPSRLIHLLDALFYMGSMSASQEAAVQFQDFICKHNLKNMAIKLGNLIFLNNIHWYLLYQHTDVQVKKAGSGIYSLETRQVIYDSDDLFLLKQQLIRFLRLLFKIADY
ncbi:Hypothetical protein DHA2_14381 [Giardia duodenalis]|nr:Hypothetical protein DHA2_14381 [Giardia intestinalis]